MNNEPSKQHKDLTESAIQAILKTMQDWSAKQPREHEFAEKLLAQIGALSTIRLAMMESLGASPETLEKIMADELEGYKHRNSIQP